VARPAALAALAALAVLAGFGARDGTPLSVLERAGLRLRGIPDFVAPDPGVGWPAVLGGVHAAAIGFLLALLVARVTARVPAALAWLPAVGVGSLVLLVDPRLPEALRLGAGADRPALRALGVTTLVAAAALAARLAARPAGADATAVVTSEHDLPSTR
ncbi:hypothetical protein PYV61_21155, partial [Roseisolibacter sp. H3M3-2]